MMLCRERLIASLDAMQWRVLNLELGLSTNSCFIVPAARLLF